MARKGWVMTPARKAYYASKKKKGGKGSLFPVTGSKKERAKWIAKYKGTDKKKIEVEGTKKQLPVGRLRPIGKSFKKHVKQVRIRRGGKKSLATLLKRSTNS